MKNYFLINRSIFENKLWFLEPFTKAQAWIDLIGNANYKDGGFMVRGNYVETKRGQIGWSEITMAERWSWSRNKVRRFLKWLEMEQQIEQQKIFKITTIITILNYELYQNDTTDDTAERQQKDNRKTSDDTQHNKDNKENKEKNVSIKKVFSKKEKTYTEKNLTLQELAVKFSNHFEEENGRKSVIAPNGYKNLAYWLEVYTPSQIAQAISQIKYDSFWKDKMDLTILFRQSSKGEPANWIDTLLNKAKEYHDRRR